MTLKMRFFRFDVDDEIHDGGTPKIHGGGAPRDELTVSDDLRNYAQQVMIVHCPDEAFAENLRHRLSEPKDSEEHSNTTERKQLVFKVVRYELWLVCGRSGIVQEVSLTGSEEKTAGAGVLFTAEVITVCHSDLQHDAGPLRGVEFPEAIGWGDYAGRGLWATLGGGVGAVVGLGAEEAHTPLGPRNRWRLRKIFEASPPLPPSLNEGRHCGLP